MQPINPILAVNGPTENGMKAQQLFGVQISTGKYRAFIEEIIRLSEKSVGSYVCVLNVHMMIEAQQKAFFKKIVNEADIVTPDGKPITWALKLLYNISQDRVAGMDLLPDLLVDLERLGKAVFFYGGTQDMLDKTKSYVQKNHPLLVEAGYYSPPFRPLSAEEEQQVANTINQSGASVIFVVLGCPKQEIWMASMKNKITGVMIGIGGAVPVIIGAQKRAPKWMQDYGLEWLFRLIQEPRRLFKRYFITNTWFIFLLLKNYIKTKF
ncbi:MAG: WecB/TagA/CpsF family glycosyltransferase [Chitinophagaceae bacterium]